MSTSSVSIISARAATGTVRRRFRKLGAALLPLALSGLAACTTVSGGGQAMRDGGIVLPPRGWTDYCGRNADDPSCRVVQLDDARWSQLRAVHASLRSIRLVTDQAAFGRAEYWQVANGSGDCEDVALAARSRLLAQGWPPSAVRLATAWTEQGAYHTVLTVDGVRHGALVTYVLDSRYAAVLSFQKLEQLGYRFDRRQAARGPTWVAIRS